jgi:glycosyltransferase involved in cell wall biosynthesis
MRKKILYLMHVDWDWIKQRPHYIAENLSKNYDVLIIHPYHMKRSQLTKNKRSNLKLRPFFHVPAIHKLNLKFALLDNLLLKIYFFFNIKKFKPDYIWLTFPDLYQFIPENHKSKIIYDCMDDVGEFDSQDKVNSKRINLEIKLIKESSAIFASSENLLHVINNRQYCLDKIKLIRNAFGGNKINIDPSDEPVKKEIYKICYIGTVASWFDFDSLHFCAQNIKNIEFHIIGPADVDIDGKHNRIIFHGPINHDLLFSYVKEFDCMIMPFKLNKLVMSVDPVKLYEYVNYNKPIISIYYKEIERFSNYVSFYSTKEELLNVINNMINTGFPTKYSNKERENLIDNNSWEIRAKEIIEFLEK